MTMLKEQLFGFAINALTRAYEAKEQIKKNLGSDILKSYVQGFKQTALFFLESRINDQREGSENLRKKPVSKVSPKAARTSASSLRVTKPYKAPKERKSSIRQAKEIHSERAEAILLTLNNGPGLTAKSDELNAKKSLSCLIWALGQAELAQVSQGISVHDVSALLYKAHNINLYPINISRVVHSNEVLVKQAGQDNRTKTYVLTTEGLRVFNEKFVQV